MTRILALVLFAVLAAPAAAGEGITLPVLVGATQRLDSVGVSATGSVYASTGGQVTVFGTGGQPIATFTAVGPMAVGRGDDLYTVDAAVTHWSWDGRVLARWGDFPPFSRLAVAPDGTVLVGGGRYTPAGEPLGPLPGPGWPSAAGGHTWMTDVTAVTGYDDDGRRIAALGNICPIGGPPGLPTCTWHFAYPRAAATGDGGVLVADTADSRIEGYDREGRLRFTCTRAIGIDYLTSIAARGDAVILGGAHGVYRAQLTDDGEPACRSPRLVTHVRVGRRGTTLRIAFTLARRADVRIRLHGRTIVRRLLRGRRTVRIAARGSGYVTVGDAPRVSYSLPRSGSGRSGG